MKNGWVQFKSLDNLWAVNSIGRVHGRGPRLHGRDHVPHAHLRGGPRLLDAIGADVFRILGSGELV